MTSIKLLLIYARVSERQTRAKREPFLMVPEFLKRKGNESQDTWVLHLFLLLTHCVALVKSFNSLCLNSQLPLRTYTRAYHYYNWKRESLVWSLLLLYTDPPNSHWLYTGVTLWTSVELLGEILWPVLCRASD